MTFDYKNFKYTPDSTNSRLLIKTQISTDSVDVWPSGSGRVLAERILSKFPKWQCVLNYSTSTTQVYNGVEYLGRVGWYNGTYEILNHRIEAKRTRRGGMKTRDADKAFRLVCKYFKPENYKERFTKVAADAGGWVSIKANSLNTLFRSKFHAVTYAAREYVLRDIQVYLEAAAANGFDTTKFLDIKEQYDEAEQARVMNEHLQKNMGCVIRREGNGYLMGDPEGTEIVSIDDTLLPQPIRLALGKLKLVEPKTLVMGAGFRLDADTFYVVVR
jgi:hypothetical protein